MCGFDDVSLLAYPLIFPSLSLSCLSLAAVIDCVFLPRDYLTNLLATTTCISLIYAARDCCEKKILMMMIPKVCLPLSPLKHSCVCRVARFCLNANNTTRRRQKRDIAKTTVVWDDLCSKPRSPQTREVPRRTSRFSPNKRILKSVCGRLARRAFKV